MMEGGVQMDAIDQEQPRGKGSRIFTILFFVVIALVVLGGLTLFQRRAQYQALAKETETLAIPTVAVFHASVESAEEDLVLPRSEEHTSELQSRQYLVCRLLLEKKKKKRKIKDNQHKYSQQNIYK